MFMVTLKGLFKTISERVSARSRIAIGQVFLLIGVLCMAIALGLIPDQRKATFDGRVKFCETIAVCGSAFVERGDVDTLDAVLRAALGRNSDVLSAALRKSDGSVLIEIGDHVAHWNKSSDDASIDSNMFVPIYTNGKKWGAIEVRFQPDSSRGFMGYLRSPQVQLIAFISAACMVLYLIYLRKMLQHLDPSKVVPGRVRSALDTLDRRAAGARRQGTDRAGQPGVCRDGWHSTGKLMGSRPAKLNWIFETPTARANFPGAGRFASASRNMAW
jgi:hypothetical protein